MSVGSVAHCLGPGGRLPASQESGQAKQDGCVHSDKVPRYRNDFRQRTQFPQGRAYQPTKIEKTLKE